MDEIAAWDLYFLTAVGWSLHPRNEDGLDLEKCASLADDMLLFRSERLCLIGKR